MAKDIKISQLKDLDSIQVSWNISYPMVARKSTFPFDNNEINTSAGNLPDPSDDIPGFDKTSWDLLHFAFENNLNRYIAWDISKVPKSQKESYRFAGSIFRRGIEVIEQNDLPSLPLSGKYPIEILGSFEKKEDLDSALFPVKNQNFIVVDRNVMKHWPLKSFDNAIVLETSEHKKTLATVGELINHWTQRNKPKDWIIIGGGVLCDTASFAANISGCSFHLVPTTLLAMADACVGGKTGVNFPPYGKNQVGRFAFPTKVTCATSFLSSLSQRDNISGLSECLKHAFLSGNKNLIQDLQKIGQSQKYSEIHTHLIDVISVKAKIVAEDPTEASIRATLNFGHTLAHAIEGYSQSVCTENRVIRHGEAVHFGMIFAILISIKEAKLPLKDATLMIDSIFQTSLYLSTAVLSHYLNEKPDSLPKIFDKLFSLISKDKKMSSKESDNTMWILLEGLGKPFKSNNSYIHSVEKKSLESTWNQFLETLNHKKLV